MSQLSEAFAVSYWGGFRGIKHAKKVFAEFEQSICAQSAWRPIDPDRPPTEQVMLYFPETKNDRYGHGGLSEMMKIGHYSAFPYRRPTHWQPKPEPPTVKDDQ
jgi:hypothetical protein